MLNHLIYLYGLKLFLVSTILIFTWAICKYIQNPLTSLGKKSSIPLELAILINKIIKTAIYAIGIITALAQLGIDVNTILASLGIGGLAISFALKDALTNIISGVIIIAYRPFMIGDEISLRSKSGTVFEGKVVDINFRYVTIETDNNRTLIPNNTAASTPVVVRK